jgi:Phage capsid family
MATLIERPPHPERVSAPDYHALVAAILPGLRGEPRDGRIFGAELPPTLRAAITWPTDKRGRTSVSGELHASGPTFRYTLLDLMPEVPMRGGMLEVPELAIEVGAGQPHVAGTAKHEAALTFTGRNAGAATIATWVSVTEQLVEDDAGLESWLQLLLAHLVKLGEERQVLLSDGLTSPILGFLAHPGIPAYSGASLDPATIIGGMIGQSTASGIEPDTVVLSPENWGTLIAAGAADVEGDSFGGLWLVRSPALSNTQYLVGPIQWLSVIGRAGGVMVEGTRSHASDFVENKAAIRASSRIALGVLVPTAFCKKV